MGSLRNDPSGFHLHMHTCAPTNTRVPPHIIITKQHWTKQSLLTSFKGSEVDFWLLHMLAAIFLRIAFSCPTFLLRCFILTGLQSCFRLKTMALCAENRPCHCVVSEFGFMVTEDKMILYILILWNLIYTSLTSKFSLVCCYSAFPKCPHLWSIQNIFLSIGIAMF